MAGKIAKTGDKRKASSTEKSGPKGSPKKPKLEVRRKPVVKSVGSGPDSFSDSEDGGVAVQPPKKKFDKRLDKNFDKSRKDTGKKDKGKPNGEDAAKTFERGKHPYLSGYAIQSFQVS